MNMERIAARLADAVATLDDALMMLDGDPDAIADIDTVICDLAELRRELEMVQFRKVSA
jgi:hypothetical protein